MCACAWVLACMCVGLRKRWRESVYIVVIFFALCRQLTSYIYGNVSSHWEFRGCMCDWVWLFVHVWQKDWNFLHAAAVLWGGMSSELRVRVRTELSLEKKILMLLLPGIKSMTLQSVSLMLYHWAIELPCGSRVVFVCVCVCVCVCARTRMSMFKVFKGVLPWLLMTTKSESWTGKI